VYTQSFIESLPHDPKKAAALMCEYFLDKEQTNSKLLVTRELYDQYMESVFKFKAFCDPYELQYEYPALNGNPERDVPMIREFFSKLQEVLKDE